MNRIQQANSTGPNWGETFTIDAWGNLTSRGPVAGKTNYEALNAPATVKNQLTGFGYDAAGNMISNGTATYSYDGENRLATAGGYTYTYDGDGRRVKRQSGLLGIVSWPDLSGRTLDESGLTGTMVREYVFFNGQRVARRDAANNAVHYFFSDHLGSTSLVTNATGTMAACAGYVSGEQETDYYPYGGEYPPFCSTISDQKFKFTGKERDAESSLDYFGARHYASSLGRYMRPDDPFADQHPGDPQSWNLYSYVRNNPLNATDPSGHECVSNSSGGWEWSGSGETCEDVDAQNAEYKQSGQASATVNGCEGEGATDCLGAMVSDLTSTSSLSEVGVNGILGAQAAEGAWELPGLFRSGWDLVSGWRMASKMAGVRAAGEAGELAAGIIKNTERISSSTGSAAYRVPDILDHANKIIGEVKNYTTTTVNLTNQLKDDLAYAAANGYTMELRVRQGVQLSQSVQQLIDQGKITLTRF